MIILNIKNKKDTSSLSKHIENGKKVFVLVHMEGCGHCTEIKPKWYAIKEQSNKYPDNEVVIADVENSLVQDSELNGKLGSINGFPHMIYIYKKEKSLIPYEESDIEEKDRSTDSFLRWIDKYGNNNRIESKIIGGRKTRRTRKSNKSRKTRKTRRTNKKRRKSRK